MRDVRFTFPPRLHIFPLLQLYRLVFKNSHDIQNRWWGVIHCIIDTSKETFTARPLSPHCLKRRQLIQLISGSCYFAKKAAKAEPSLTPRNGRCAMKLSEAKKLFFEYQAMNSKKNHHAQLWTSDRKVLQCNRRQRTWNLVHRRGAILSDP